MSFGELWRRIKFLLHRGTDIDDLEEEMQLHAELRARRLREQGLPSEDAAAAARRQFGNRTGLKEAAWEMWSFAPVEILWRDLRFAARILRKNPGFTLTAVLTLALGIGANTAVFSVVDAVLLRPFPYPSPDKLGSLTCVFKMRTQQGLLTGMFTDQDGQTWQLVRDHAHGLDSAVFSDMSSTVNIGGPDHVRYVRQQRVSSGFFRVLGIAPIFGREFTRAEDTVGGPKVAVIGYGLWKSALHGDRSLLNRPILLRGEPYVIVGVMPPGFKTPALADVWTPLRPSTQGEGANRNYEIITRLKPGASWPQAISEVETIGAQSLRSIHLDPGESLRITLLPLQKAWSDEIRAPVLMLWCAVGVVLLICSINIAGLMLVRGAARRHEIATRMAVGGGRTQVVRQLLVESLLLSLLSGAAGLAAGYIGIAGLKIAARQSLNVWQNMGLDARVFTCACAITVLAAILFSVYPALEASRLDLRAGLADAGTRTVAGVRNLWPRRILIVGEVALGLILLVAAGLFVRSYFFLRNQAQGFDATNVVTATLPLQDARYQTNQKVNLLFQQALSRIRTLAGIESAAFGMSLPYERGLNTTAKLPGGLAKDTTLTYVTPDYFHVLRIPILEGRVFSDLDREHSKQVVIVNQTFVRVFFGKQDALGKSVFNWNHPSEIVGVVADLPALGSLGEYHTPVTPIPTILVPVTQIESFELLNTWFTPSCLVRGSAPEPVVVTGMQKAMKSVDPLLPFSEFRTIGKIRSAALAQQQFQAMLMAALAALSLLLAAVGIYGLIAQSVIERTREFGIRIAVGATNWQAAQSAMRPAILLTILGCFIGIAASLATVRLMRSVIWGVSPADPETFAATAALLLLVSIVASFV
ncbi:MAG: ABC transporter permease, partial [Bryobacteraceae bacterium]